MSDYELLMIVLAAFTNGVPSAKYYNSTLNPSQQMT